MRLGRPTAVYLDANAIIQSVERNEEALLYLVENAVVGLLLLYTSELTLAEVLAGPLKTGNDELVAQYEDLLISDDSLQVVPIARSILRRSAELQATYGNKGPDSIHLATAMAHECKIFVSSDRRLHLPPGLVRMRSSDVIGFEDWP